MNVGWQDKINPEKMSLMERFMVADTNEVKALDLGAGAGWYSRYLVEKGYEVTALDHEVRFELDRCTVKEADLEKPLELESDQFDVILAWDIIEHVANEEQLLREIHRVAKPGAIVFVSVPHGDDSRISSSYLTHCHYKDKTHKREYMPQDFQDTAANFGFKIDTLYLSGGNGYPYVVLCFVDNFFFKFLLRIILKLYTVAGLIQIKNCHADIFSVWKCSK